MQATYFLIATLLLCCNAETELKTLYETVSSKGEHVFTAKQNEVLCFANIIAVSQLLTDAELAKYLKNAATERQQLASKEEAEQMEAQEMKVSDKMKKSSEEELSKINVNSADFPLKKYDDKQRQYFMLPKDAASMMPCAEMLFSGGNDNAVLVYDGDTPQAIKKAAANQEAKPAQPSNPDMLYVVALHFAGDEPAKLDTLIEHEMLVVRDMIVAMTTMFGMYAEKLYFDLKLDDGDADRCMNIGFNAQFQASDSMKKRAVYMSKALFGNEKTKWYLDNTLQEATTLEMWAAKSVSMMITYEVVSELSDQVTPKQLKIRRLAKKQYVLYYKTKLEEDKYYPVYVRCPSLHYAENYVANLEKELCWTKDNLSNTLGQANLMTNAIVDFTLAQKMTLEYTSGLTSTERKTSIDALRVLKATGCLAGAVAAGVGFSTFWWVDGCVLAFDLVFGASVPPPFGYMFVLGTGGAVEYTQESILQDVVEKQSPRARRLLAPKQQPHTRT